MASSRIRRGGHLRVGATSQKTVLRRRRQQRRRRTRHRPTQKGSCSVRCRSPASHAVIDAQWPRQSQPRLRGGQLKAWCPSLSAWCPSLSLVPVASVAGKMYEWVGGAPFVQVRAVRADLLLQHADTAHAARRRQRRRWLQQQQRRGWCGEWSRSSHGTPQSMIQKTQTYR